VVIQPPTTEAKVECDAPPLWSPLSQHSLSILYARSLFLTTTLLLNAVWLSIVFCVADAE
jgi:hypothetical protein